MKTARISIISKKNYINIWTQTHFVLYLFSTRLEESLQYYFYVFEYNIKLISHYFLSTLALDMM